MNEMNKVLDLEFAEPPEEDINKFVLAEDKIRLFIAGDSTACNYRHTGDMNRFPRTGWAQVLQERFNDKVQIVNCAISGRSSKSFKTEVNYEYIRGNIRPGDYLLIQFAHNDAKESDKSRYTSPVDGSYQSHIGEYIDLAQSKAAVPILASSVTRNIPSDHSLEPYNDAIRKISSDENIPMLDIYSLSHALLESDPFAANLLFMNLKPQDMRFAEYPEFLNSEYYEKGSADNSHLNINGARKIAGFAVKELKRLKHPLSAYLK